MENDVLIGKQLGAYRIQAGLGEGGMARVYKAYHERLRREVAIKVILPQMANQADFQARFEREAQLVAKLRHRNIVTVYDFGENNTLMYLVMQYVSGGTLRDQLSSRQPLEPRRAALYALQIARALHEAHLHDIVHRDVKPANMLISSTNRNELLLSDFGIARLFDRRQETTPTPSDLASGGNRHSLADGSRMVGTPRYMAPEQFTGKRVDARTDVYALGVVLFEMLTGQLPFQADNFLGFYYQHVYTLPKPLRELNPAVPEMLEQITMRALAKTPEDRYQSADELVEALKSVLVPSPRRERSAVASSPSRYKSLFRAKTIATVLIIVLVIVQLLITLGILHWHGIGSP